MKSSKLLFVFNTKGKKNNSGKHKKKQGGYDFSQTHKRQASKCKKLTKANVQKEWPVWKAEILEAGPWK